MRPREGATAETQAISKPWLRWLTIPIFVVFMEQSVLAGSEVFRAGPPVEIQQVRPPAEIQRVKPPAEIQKVKPPDEVQRVSPPSEVQRVKPPEDMRRGVPAPEIRQVPAQVHRELPQPDLRLRALGLSSTRPKVGERVVITARVRNSGDESARRVRVTFLAGDKEIASRFVDLPPGATEAVSASFIPDTVGSQPLRVQVSPGSAPAGAVSGTLTTARTITVLADPDEAYARTGQAPAATASLAKKETEIARQPGGGSGATGGTGSPGSPPVSGPPGLHDPTGGLGDTSKPKGVPDTTPWGSSRTGKADLGDGIMGVHDQDGLPKTGLGEGIPKTPTIPKTVGPHRGGPDAGYYGGISPKYNPGGAAKGKKSKDQGSGDAFTGGKYNPKTDANEKKHKTEKEAKESAKKLAIEFWKIESATVHEGTIKSAEFVDHGDNVYSVTRTYGGGEKDHIWSWSEGRTSYFKYVTHKELKTPRPDGDSKEGPRGDPQLILKLTRLADKQQKGDSFRPDEGVSDPVPIRGSKAASGPEGGGASPAKGGELAAAGAAKAEAKWRFAGKKPGSEVTDPAEWQDRKLRDFSMARMKYFEVIDPVEAPGLQGALAKAQASSASGAAGRSVTVASVAGGVQKLAAENGRQGWAPLIAGDKLTRGSILRVDSTTGGEVGVGNADAALPMNWSQIHSSSGHAVYLLSIRE
jgi:hypothetical protein